MTRAGGLRRAFNDIMSDDWPYGSRSEPKRCTWCECEIPPFTIPFGVGPNHLLACLCKQCTRALIATGEDITL